MGSKGRGPPPVLRHPPPGPGLVHHDPFGPPIRPPPGDFPPFERLPPPEILEQKIAAQRVDMQKIDGENQRFANTHVTLRRELAAANQDLQMLHVQIEAIKSNREQETKNLTEKIAQIEAELQAAEPIKIELQQAQVEARALFAAKQELSAKVQLLNQDLQRAYADVQQIPPLLAELENLKKEYQQCRTTYERERKSYNDHLESLQVMEKNYMTMSAEVEKLRAELANTSNADRRAGGPYGGSTGYSENEAANTYTMAQNVYGDGYGVYQGRGPLPTVTNAGGAAGVASPHVGAQGLPPSNKPYDASNMPSYDTQRGGVRGGLAGHGYEAQVGSGGPGYDAQRGSALAAYEAQRGHGYDTMRGPAYDAQRAAAYDAYRGAGYDGYGAAVYDGQRGSAYDASAKASVGTQGQTAAMGNPHGSSTPPAHVGGPGYDAAAAAAAAAAQGNPARR